MGQCPLRRTSAVRALQSRRLGTFVAAGVPKRGDWIRRETRPGPSAPQINLDAPTINFGTVKGQIAAVKVVIAPGGRHTNLWNTNRDLITSEVDGFLAQIR